MQQNLTYPFQGDKLYQLKLRQWLRVFNAEAETALTNLTSMMIILGESYAMFMHFLHWKLFLILPRLLLHDVQHM